ncbi:hypothetical protein ACHAQA_009703 [Verticillium albo-atrum]
MQQYLTHHATHQEIRVNFRHSSDGQKMAMVYFDFYNGAMNTAQCSRLLDALRYIISSHLESPLSALILMGGPAYFSNGIALNVIEAAHDPSQESWNNINRMNDVVECVLKDFAANKIFTAAAIRGNCAAGGVALAASCDLVIAGSDVVLNPAYRGLGLHGSEFHTLSYPGRCGIEGSKLILGDMKPMSAAEAQRLGLVDRILPGYGEGLDDKITTLVQMIAAGDAPSWKLGVDISATSLATVKTEELGEMAKDFWSIRAKRYHGRRRDFVRKRQPTRTPLRFAEHRRKVGMKDEEECSDFDNAEQGEEEEALRMLNSSSPMLNKSTGRQMKNEMWEPVFTCHYSNFG